MRTNLSTSNKPQPSMTVIGIPITKAKHSTLFLKFTAVGLDVGPQGFASIRIEGTIDGEIFESTLTEDSISSEVWLDRLKDKPWYPKRVEITAGLFTVPEHTAKGVVGYQLGATWVEEEHEIKVGIRTDDRIPLTVGALYLKSTSRTDPDIFRQWLSEICAGQRQQVSQVTIQQSELDELKAQAIQLEAANRQMETDHARIVEDMQLKFGHALNNKKQRIFELERGLMPPDKLFGLNEVYARGEGRLAMLSDETEIKKEVDEKFLPTNVKKEPKDPKKPAAKRERTKKTPAKRRRVEVLEDDDATDISDDGGKVYKTAANDTDEDEPTNPAPAEEDIPPPPQPSDEGESPGQSPDSVVEDSQNETDYGSDSD